MTIVRRKKREIGGGKLFKKWADWAIGDFIVGEFVGQSTDNYGNACFHIKLESVEMQEPTDYKGNELVPGKVMGLNSCGSLEYKMGEVDVGTILEIEYEGTEVLPENHKFKGKDCHQVKVTECSDEEESEADSSGL